MVLIQTLFLTRIRIWVQKVKVVLTCYISEQIVFSKLRCHSIKMTETSCALNSYLLKAVNSDCVFSLREIVPSSSYDFTF